MQKQNTTKTGIAGAASHAKQACLPAAAQLALSYAAGETMLEHPCHCVGVLAILRAQIGMAVDRVRMLILVC